GPVAIHAGKKPPDLAWNEGGWGIARLWHGDGGHYVAHNGIVDAGAQLPLGCIGAVVDLVDVVPMVPPINYVGDGAWLSIMRRPDPTDLSLRRRDERGSLTDRELTDQLPFGDFTPGRFAWITDRPRPLSEPLAFRGAQGLRRLPDEVAREVKE